VCIFLFRRSPFLGLPADFPIDDASRVLFNDSLNRVVGIALILMAALFAARAVKRSVRVKQLWGEKDTARL